MDSAQKQLVCRVYGNVQGVGFRWNVREAARRLGCTGWVRNLRDGTVELVAEGPGDAVEQLRVFCYRGPDGATVTRVDSEERPATGAFHEFAVAE